MTTESELLFSDVYEVAFSYAFEKDSHPPKKKIGNRDEPLCRFCNCENPVFRGDSHVIPAGLGNRSLFSLEECEGCNDPWGSDLEDSLAKLLFLTRAVARIRKRKGGVKYKRAPQSQSSVSSKPDENLVVVKVGPDDDSVTMEELGDNNLLLTVQGQPYSPMKAVKALARLGVFVLDRAELEQCKHIVQWLRGEVEYKPYFIRVFVPGTGRRLVRLRVYRRLREIPNAAPFVVHLSYSTVDLIFPFPESSLEQPEIPVLPFPGFSNYPPFVPSVEQIQILSDGIEKEPVESITLKYQNKESFEDLEAIEEHRKASGSSPPTELLASTLPAEVFDAALRGPVDVVVADGGGKVLFQGPATIGLKRGMNDSVAIELTGVRAPWSLELSLGANGGVIDPVLPTQEGETVPCAAEIFAFEYALCHGVSIEARNVHDHAPIFYTEFNMPGLTHDDQEHFEGLKKIYERLAIIDAVFPDVLKVPKQIGPDDVKRIEFLSTGLEIGEFEDSRQPLHSIPMNSLSIDYLESEFSGGNKPEGLKAHINLPIQLFDGNRSGGYFP